MEKKHPLLYEDDYKSRTNALMKCAEAALDNHFTIFSVQNGGQCFSGKDAEQTFMKYGVSNTCKGTDYILFNLSVVLTGGYTSYTSSDFEYQALAKKTNKLI